MNPKGHNTHTDWEPTKWGELRDCKHGRVLPSFWLLIMQHKQTHAYTSPEWGDRVPRFETESTFWIALTV